LKLRVLPSWSQVLSRVLEASPPPAPSLSGLRGSASREVLAPTDTTTPGAPSPSRTPLRSHVRDEDRQTLVGAVLRVLAPLDGSGRSRLARGLLDPADRRDPRRFAALFHAARVPGAPLQSFPFPGSRTRSRRPLLPCGFVLRLPPAQWLQVLHDRFRRIAPALRPHAHPEADAGLMSRDDGSSRSLVRSPRPARASPRSHVARTVHSPPTLGSPVNGRHARFEALLPPGVRSATTPALARPRSPVGALLGFLPSRALSTSVLGPVSRADTRQGAEPLDMHLRVSSHSRLQTATRTPTPGLASPGSVTRGVYRTSRVTVGRQPSSHIASRASCAPAASSVLATRRPRRT